MRVPQRLEARARGLLLPRRHRYHNNVPPALLSSVELLASFGAAPVALVPIALNVTAGAVPCPGEVWH